jgi:hypothetical protein
MMEVAIGEVAAEVEVGGDGGVVGSERRETPGEKNLGRGSLLMIPYCQDSAGLG